MNSIEATRCLAVIEDVRRAFSLLSYVNEDVVTAPEQLKGALGEEAVACLLQQRDQLLACSCSRSASGGSAGEEMQPHPTLALLRTLVKAEPSAQAALAAAGASRSSAAAQLLEFLARLQAQLSQRLASSVEEDAADASNLTDLAQKQARATSDQAALEGKLAAARAERAQQAAAMQGAEDAVQAALHEGYAQSDNIRSAVNSAAAEARSAARGAFEAVDAAVSKELDALRGELVSVRAEAADATEAALKARRRAAQACEVAVSEYDSELGEREERYQQALGALQQQQAQIEKLRAETQEMRREAELYEAAQAARAQERRRAERAALRRECAAYTIQNAWKRWKRARAAATTAAKGGGKKGGKKGAPGKKRK